MRFTKFIRIVKVILTDKNARFKYLAALGIYNQMSDEEFIKRMYISKTGLELDLDTPKTYNEKLQWLKLYDRNPIYTTMVDKYAVKKYIAEKIGEEYIIPMLGVWNSFEEIDFDRLPEQFVLKSTHDSGGVVIVKEKNIFDKKTAKKKLKKSLNRNFYYVLREWPYKNVKPRIIAEKYMEDESGTELKDYKIFCFNGRPRIIEVDYNRFVEHKRNLYTTDWEYINATLKYPTDKNYIIEKPQELKKMLELAEKLSQGIPHVRVDFYYINGKIYFGELTFFHGAGYEKVVPESLGIKMGEWIELPEKYCDKFEV